jgi:hypothetical protein
LSRTGTSAGAPRRLRDDADSVDAMLTRHGEHFEAVEHWNEPNNLLDWEWRADPDHILFRDDRRRRLRLHGSLETVLLRHAWRLRSADTVIVGSHVPDGIEFIDLLAAMEPRLLCFCDIDMPPPT